MNFQLVSQATDGTVAYKSSVPYGNYPPNCWLLAVRAGGIASRGRKVAGSGTFTAGIAGGKNATANLSGSGGLSPAPSGQLVVSGTAALSGSGSIANADLRAILQASAALSGSGSLSATSTAIGYLLAALSGSGSLSAPNYATGELAADIQPFTELSPQSLAAAVWQALSAEFDEAGTMGEKLNDAGSAANPWTEIIEQHGSDSLTAVEVLRLILAASAGKLSGATGPTVVIRDALDHIDRITATVDGDGNRTAVTLDVGD